MGDGPAGPSPADPPAVPPGGDAPSAPPQPPPPVAVFKRPAGRGRANLRRRPADSDDDGGEGESDAGVAKRPRPAPPLPRGRGALVASTSDVRPAERAAPARHGGDRALLAGGSDSRATATLETETQFDRDARAVREAVLGQASGLAPAADDGVYRGAKAYTDYRAGFRREHTVGAEKGSGAHGPLRASMHARVSVRVDHAPDVCKDYKETGYCGYGDACKFLHDRGDYKCGWQIDKAWEEKQEREKEAQAAAEQWAAAEEGEGGAESGSGSDDDGLPFACFACRRPWADVPDPVVTRCKHYFCEQCALKHNATSPKCFVCDAPTAGIFNVAHDILAKQKKAQRRAGG